MIVDLDNFESDPNFTCDVCIIGSGAAGITLAREFIGHTADVVVLEGGGASFEESAQELYRAEMLGLAHDGTFNGRFRVLGGTTTRWAGQALPLFEIDFQERPWVSLSGWPIKRSELDPYYHRAESVLEIPHSTYDVSTWPGDGSPPAYNPSLFVPRYSQFTDRPNFVTKYGGDLKAANNIRLVTHANAIEIEAAEDGSKVRAVRARSLSGRSARVTAEAVVVCCGGIESARLLLLSDSDQPMGIGNKHDVVGRYFQDHYGVGIPVTPRNPARFSKAYDSIRRGRTRYGLRIDASPKFQEEREILHMNAEIYYPSDGSLGAAKRILTAWRDPSLRSRVPSLIAAVAKDPWPVLRAGYRRLVLNQPASVGSTRPFLGVGGEQGPSASSRVMLSRETDALGLRRAAVAWQLGHAETRSVTEFVRALSMEWDRLDLADLDLDAVTIEGREHGEHGGYVDAKHHIGTTRMGDDPRTSVVDARCRVHGYSNLFVGSSSVFPTGGASNPTLTILALTLRIADDIKDLLKRGGPLSGRSTLEQRADN